MVVPFWGTWVIITWSSVVKWSTAAVFNSPENSHMGMERIDFPPIPGRDQHDIDTCPAGLIYQGAVHIFQRNGGSREYDG